MIQKTCHMKHFCRRESFNRKREMYTAQSYKESKYEVWDPYYQSPDEESDEVLVYESDDKSECEAFIASGAQRCELRENGVCGVCDLYDCRQADLKVGKVPPFFLVVSSTCRYYGGPEEGGWWYDKTYIEEVFRAYTLKEGLRRGRELKEKYPQPKYNRYSCANRGEGDIRIQLCYSECDPRWPSENPERPRFE